MTKLWFKAKEYGYGWYPVTWEGWVVTLGYAALITVPLVLASSLEPEFMKQTYFPFLFIPYVIVITAVMLWISYRKGEPPGWRWGGEKR